MRTVLRTAAIVLGLNLGALVVISATVPTEAHALSKDTRVLLKSGLYGTLVGAGTGLLSHALGAETQTIFVGASVGLYMGLALGAYYVWDRDEIAKRRQIESETIASHPCGEGRCQHSFQTTQPPPLLEARFTVANF